MSDPDEILTVMQQDMCGPLVGRARELARLVDLLDSVARGEAAVALVSGDAGVGKTRLVTELAGPATGRGLPLPGRPGPSAPGAPPGRPPLRRVVPDLLRLPQATPGDLGPLEPVSLAAHIATLAALTKQRTLDAAELGTIVDRAEGNAYYAEELLAAS